jgi:hypothetical protein
MVHNTNTQYVSPPSPSEDPVLAWFGTPAAYAFATMLAHARNDRSTDPAEIVSTAYLTVSNRAEALRPTDAAAAGRQQLRFAQMALWRSRGRHDRRRDELDDSAESAMGYRSDPAEEAFSYGIDDLYDHLATELRAASTDRAGEAIAVTLALSALALNEGRGNPSPADPPDFGLQREHDVAVATAMVDPRLSPTGPTSAALRQARKRLMDRVRTVAAPALQNTDSLVEAA